MSATKKRGKKDADAISVLIVGESTATQSLNPLMAQHFTSDKGDVEISWTLSVHGLHNEDQVNEDIQAAEAVVFAYNGSESTSLDRFSSMVQELRPRLDSHVLVLAFGTSNKARKSESKVPEVEKRMREYASTTLECMHAHADLSDKREGMELLTEFAKMAYRHKTAEDPLVFVRAVKDMDKNDSRYAGNPWFPQHFDIFKLEEKYDGKMCLGSYLGKTFPFTWDLVQFIGQAGPVPNPVVFSEIEVEEPKKKGQLIQSQEMFILHLKSSIGELNVEHEFKDLFHFYEHLKEMFPPSMVEKLPSFPNKKGMLSAFKKGAKGEGGRALQIEKFFEVLMKDKGNDILRSRLFQELLAPQSGDRKNTGGKGVLHYDVHSAKAAATEAEQRRKGLGTPPNLEDEAKSKAKKMLITGGLDGDEGVAQESVTQVVSPRSTPLKSSKRVEVEEADEDDDGEDDSDVPAALRHHIKERKKAAGKPAAKSGGAKEKEKEKPAAEEPKKPPIPVRGEPTSPPPPKSPGRSSSPSSPTRTPAMSITADGKVKIAPGRAWTAAEIKERQAQKEKEDKEKEDERKRAKLAEKEKAAAAEKEKADKAKKAGAKFGVALPFASDAAALVKKTANKPDEKEEAPKQGGSLTRKMNRDLPALPGHKPTPSILLAPTKKGEATQALLSTPDDDLDEHGLQAKIRVEMETKMRAEGESQLREAAEAKLQAQAAHDAHTAKASPEDDENMRKELEARLRAEAQAKLKAKQSKPAHDDDDDEDPSSSDVSDSDGEGEGGEHRHKKKGKAGKAHAKSVKKGVALKAEQSKLQAEAAEEAERSRKEIEQREKKAKQEKEERQRKIAAEQEEEKQAELARLAAEEAEHNRKEIEELERQAVEEAESNRKEIERLEAAGRAEEARQEALRDAKAAEEAERNRREIEEMAQRAAEEEAHAAQEAAAAKALESAKKKRETRTANSKAAKKEAEPAAPSREALEAQIRAEVEAKLRAEAEAQLRAQKEAEMRAKMEQEIRQKVAAEMGLPAEDDEPPPPPPPEDESVYVCAEIESPKRLRRAALRALIQIGDIIKGAAKIFDGHEADTKAGEEAKKDNAYFVLVFPSVKKALQCCACIQVACVEHNWPKYVTDLPSCRKQMDMKTGKVLFHGPRLCMGIGLGDPSSANPDEWAIRLARSSHGGQMLVQEPVYKQWKDIKPQSDLPEGESPLDEDGKPLLSDKALSEDYQCTKLGSFNFPGVDGNSKVYELRCNSLASRKFDAL